MHDLWEDAYLEDPQDFWEQQYKEASEGEVMFPMPTEEQCQIAWDEPLKDTFIQRRSLTEVEDLWKLDGLIDGGYLSFIYGSRIQASSGWHMVKMKYANYLMLLDSGGVRQKEYPLYKSRRGERRDLYPHMKETYERVKAFREILKNDPAINTAIIEGYEADDIIPLLFMKGIGAKRVIAQDKDFFMVPNLGNAMTDHTGVPQFYRGLKLPKYAIAPNKPGTWALTQAVFGDKSDSIPRLLPSRRGYRELYNVLIRQAPNLLSAFWNCYAEWGEQFVINLRLVLLPHPTLSMEDYDDMPNLLFEDLADGSYWDPDHFNDSILLEVLKSVGDMEWL
jgi:hypothetical protein